MIFSEAITKTEKHIDWLSITLDSSKNWRQFLPLTSLHFTGRGRHGYAETFVDSDTGARIETGSLDTSMGHHFTLTGAVLDCLRDNVGMVDNALCNRIQAWEAKCSRIDLAIDIYGAQFTPTDLNQALHAGDAWLPARTWRFIDGHRAKINGATIDTGSPSSDRRFRFYDKRAEQGIKDGEAWVRLELQLRRLYARASVGAIVEHGVSSATSGAIGSYLTWSHPDYLSAIASEGCDWKPIQHKPSARQKWLLGQVAKALADEVTIHPDFIMRFMIAVRAFGEGNAKRNRT